MKEPLYTDGLDMNNWKHIPEISCYNNNYYVGFNKDLLFGHSDDDNITEWYVIRHQMFVYLGESFMSEGELLTRYDSPQT